MLFRRRHRRTVHRRHGGIRYTERVLSAHRFDLRYSSHDACIHDNCQLARDAGAPAVESMAYRQHSGQAGQGAQLAFVAVRAQRGAHVCAGVYGPFVETDDHRYSYNGAVRYNELDISVLLFAVYPACISYQPQFAGKGECHHHILARIFHCADHNGLYRSAYRGSIPRRPAGYKSLPRDYSRILRNRRFTHFDCVFRHERTRYRPPRI